jgi:hypothetical protein
MKKLLPLLTLTIIILSCNNSGTTKGSSVDTSRHFAVFYFPWDSLHKTKQFSILWTARYDSIEVTSKSGESVKGKAIEKVTYVFRFFDTTRDQINKRPILDSTGKAVLSEFYHVIKPSDVLYLDDEPLGPFMYQKKDSMQAKVDSLIKFKSS